MGLQTPVLFIILLGVLITVHELGHFLIAKWLNVKVLRFSVGFGPKIVGFTRGETEYRIAWIPLGGYVKMAGELPHDEVTPEDAARGFLAQPPWKRALIVIGGPLFNLIFPIIIYFFLFVGDQQALSSRVAHVEPDLPAAMAGLRPGDRIVAVDGEPVVAFSQVDERIEGRANQPTRLTVQRGDESVNLTVTPVSAFVADPLESGGRGRIGISPVSPPPLVGVPAGSPAAEAGLRTFDRIVSIDGRPIADLAALEEALKAAGPTVEVTVARADTLGLPGIRAAAPNLETVTVNRTGGEGLASLGVEPSSLYLSTVVPGGPAAEAGLKRGDRLVSLNGEPLTSFEAFQAAIQRAGTKPFKLQWQSGGETKTATLSRGKFDVTDPVSGQKAKARGVGVSPGYGFAAENARADYITVNVGIGDALVRALKTVPDVTIKTVKVLAALIVGDVPFDSLGGPVMIYSLAGRAVEEGAAWFFGLMAVISINLGVMNLLPIPVLDGFALLSAIWEGVRRRPIPMRVREVANMVGLAVLVILMVLVIRNDLMR